MRTLKDDHPKGFYAPRVFPHGFLPWPLPLDFYSTVPFGVEPENATPPDDQTQLDHDEIPERPARPALPPPEQIDECPCSDFRHSGWKDIRRRVYAGLKAANVPSSRLRRFAECGKAAWIEGTYSLPHNNPSTGQPCWEGFRVRCNTCRDRFCVPCAGTRARIVARCLIQELGGEPARFITLTRKHNDLPLREQVDALYSAYKRLRKTALWQRHVYAAAALLEIKRSSNDGCWHPHLHVLAKGRYVPHANLKAEWHRITEDSFIVDIRMIRDPARAASYVSKYVTKPMVATYSTDADAVQEAIQAMHHRRTVLLTGDWQKLQFEKQTDDGLWQYIGTLDSLLHRALAGEHDAVEILNSLPGKSQWRKALTGPAP